MSVTPASLWEDLRRRRVVQVAVVYAASAWVVVQVADTFQAWLGVPPWLMTALSAAVIAGFPVTVILAWLFDYGPDGVVRTKPGSATGVLAIGLSLALLGAGTAGIYWMVDPAGDGARSLVADEFEPDPFSLAVLPFTDFSPDQSLGHFTYGIAGVLIDQLAQIGSLTVISDRSSRAVPKDMDVREIGRQLNVAQLVEGTVQRAGSRLRITAQLVDTRSGEALWTRRFDPDDADIFAIQEQIALAVANAIDVAVEPAVRDRLRRPITNDEAAYDLYLRGRASIAATEIRGDFSEGIAYLERALELDSELALAWAGLSSVIFWQGRNGYLDFEDAVERSWAASNRAIQIDPRLGEAYSHRILLHTISGDKDEVRLAYERAVEYNPSWPYSYLAFGMVLNAGGRFDEAIEVLKRGLDLQPFRPDPLLRQNLAQAYIETGRYEDGMRIQARNYLEHKGTNKEAQYLHWMAGTALGAHRFDEAAALLAIGRSDGLDNSTARRIAASAALGMGRIEEAKQHIARANAMRIEESAGMVGYHPETPFIESARARIALENDDDRAVLELVQQVTQFVAANPEGQIEKWRQYEICYWYLALRLYEEAARWTALLVVDGGDVENLTMAAFAHDKIGKNDLAETYRRQAATELESALTRSPQSKLILVMGASFHAVSGNSSNALDLLERAYDAHYRDIVYLTQMPLFDPIRGEPRYREILRRIHSDIDEMSRRYDEVAADKDFERLVERHLRPQVAVNFYY